MEENWAVIKDGRIINTIVADDNFILNSGDVGCQYIKYSDFEVKPKIGWFFDTEKGFYTNNIEEPVQEIAVLEEDILIPLEEIKPLEEVVEETPE